MLLLLSGISLLFESPTAFAQPSIACDEPSTYPSEITIPTTFQGDFYTFTWAGTDREELVISRINQDEQIALSLPASLEASLQALTIFPRRLSPDGRFLFFSPNTRNDTAPFVIWDRETDEVAEFRLSDEKMDAWRSQVTPDRILQDMWIDDTLFQIGFYGQYGTNLESRQLINLSVSPLTVSLSTYESFPSSVWVTDNEPNYSVLQSPNLTFVSVLTATPFDNSILDPVTVNIFRRDNGNHVYNFTPLTLSRHVVGHPDWSFDEKYFILTLTDERFTYIDPLVIDATNGFSEVTSLKSTIEAVLPVSRFRYLTDVNPTWSHDGSKVAISIEGGIGNKYIAIYDFPSQTTQLFCDGGEARSETTIPFWSPDDRYFGYTQGGRTYAFELATGNTYRFPDTFGFLGWIPEG